MEGDLDELAERVFRGEKKPASSIQIIGSFETRKDLFEALLMLFTKGMKILYGNKEGHVDLKCLTSVEFQEFKERFEILGITPIVKMYHVSDILKLEGQPVSTELLDDKESHKDLYPTELTLSDLSDYQTIPFKDLSEGRFQLRCENNYYILQFNTLLKK